MVSTARNAASQTFHLGFWILDGCKITQLLVLVLVLLVVVVVVAVAVAVVVVAAGGGGGVLVLVLVLVLFLFLLLLLLVVSPKKTPHLDQCVGLGGNLILFIEMAMGDFPVATFDVRRANP